MTVLPDIAGAGNGDGNEAGNDTLIVRPAAVIVAIGPLPSPDNATPAVVTAAEILPPSPRYSVESRSFHDPPAHLRTGAVDCVSVSDPSGLAATESVRVVSAGTATACPADLAEASARSSAPSGTAPFPAPRAMPGDAPAETAACAAGTVPAAPPAISEISKTAAHSMRALKERMTISPFPNGQRPHWKNEKKAQWHAETRSGPR
jgi:hypothetical protein